MQRAVRTTRSFAQVDRDSRDPDRGFATHLPFTWPRIGRNSIGCGSAAARNCTGGAKKRRINH
jgi:hypothetical protein